MAYQEQGGEVDDEANHGCEPEKKVAEHHHTAAARVRLSISLRPEWFPSTRGSRPGFNQKGFTPMRGSPET